MIQNPFQRLLCIAAVSVSALLSACGGASSTVDPLRPDRVIAFGDGFNAVDASGYGVNTVQAVANTDLPDDTVAGRLAYNKYGITLTRVSGTAALDSTKKGFSYAHGLARIEDTVTKGVDNTVDGIEKQIDNFLAGNRPGNKDLFIISAGSLDIYDAFTNNTTLAAPVTALVAAIKRLTDAGAKYVLIVYPPNMARTPWAIRKTSADRNTVQDLSYDTGTTCSSFSCRTTIALNTEYPATSSRQPILLADLMGYSNLITGTGGTTTVTFKGASLTTTGTGSLNTFQTYGVANPDLPACFNITTSPTNALRTDAFTPPSASLTCATTTANAAGGVNSGTSGWISSLAWDYKTSVFADNFYFTPFANRLYADYIFNVTMFRAGWR